MGSFRMRRPNERTYEDLGDPELNEAAFPATGQPVYDEEFIPEPVKRLTIPTVGIDRLLWNAYIRGASWVGDLYADPEDDAWETTPHGRAMLGDFHLLLAELKPEPKAEAGQCNYGRPYRQHARKCMPDCTYQES